MVMPRDMCMRMNVITTTIAIIATTIATVATRCPFENHIAQALFHFAACSPLRSLLTTSQQRRFTAC